MNEMKKLLGLIAVATLCFACSSGEEDESGDDSGKSDDPRVAAILALTPNVASGESLYKSDCVACHGESGRGSGEGAADDLVNSLATNGDEASLTTILDGVPGTLMIRYEGVYSDQEFADILAYAKTLGGG